MQKIDLNDIRATPIEEVAERLGIKVVRHTALCPFHEDRHPSLHFDRKRNRFKCFACGAGGNVIDLVMRYMNITFKEAMRNLSPSSPLSPRSPLLTSPRGGTENASSADGGAGSNQSLPLGGDGGGLGQVGLGAGPDIEYLSTLVAHPVINADAAHFLYDERKIDPRVVRWCGLTSIEQPTPCWRWGKPFYEAPSLLIPYRDVDGKLLTVQGRRLSQSPLLTSPRGGTKNASSADGGAGSNQALPLGGDGGGLGLVGLGGLDIEYLSTLVAHPVINADAAHFLYDERKIDPRVVRWCGLTSIEQPTPCWRWGKPFYEAPSLLIPYRDVDGKLLTVQGRRLSQSPLLTSPRGGTKNASSADGGAGSNLTLPLGGDGGGLELELSVSSPRFRFPRGSNVGMYNKPVIRRLKPGDELWITEGPSDCWAMLSAGHKAVAIPSATSLTKADVGLLRYGLPEGVTLHMYPDHDEPGMKLFEDLKRWFPQLKGHVLPEGYKDFGQWYGAERQVL